LAVGVMTPAWLLWIFSFIWKCFAFALKTSRRFHAVSPPDPKICSTSFPPASSKTMEGPFLRQMMRIRIPSFFALMALAGFCMARAGSSQQAGGQAPATPAPASDAAQPQLKNKAYDVVLPVTVRDKKGAL